MNAMRHVPTGHRVLWDGARLAVDLETNERIFVAETELEADPTWCPRCRRTLAIGQRHRCRVKIRW